MNNNAIRTLVVCGTFDNKGGKPSGLMNKLFNTYPENYIFVNGGYYEHLQQILEDTVAYDIIYWFANVDNDLPKIRNVKEVNPKCILITSKRNDNDKYCFEELINRALGLKANLVFEFSKSAKDDLFNIRVFDPLGVLWCDRTNDYKKVIDRAYNRIQKLACYTRQQSVVINDKVSFETEPRFIDIIHDKAEIFHKLVQPPEVVERFLGNVSFRCTHGFPSFRGN
jgi:hypothetical protein